MKMPEKVMKNQAGNTRESLGKRQGKPSIAESPIASPPPERKGLNAPEPAPIRNDSRPIWELVVEDMQARDVAGRQKYGTPLQSHNGRNALVDAYQEVLDLAVYLRQKIEEEKP